MNFQNNTFEIISNHSINVLNDEILFQFYYKCKTNILDLDTWITENKLIINSAVSIDSSKFSGYTPLHFAVKCCNYNAICILLKYNANCNIKNANNQTPLHLAMQMILIKKSFKSNKKLQIILDEMLLSLKTSCTCSVDNIGLSHFHIACYRNGKGVTCLTKYGFIVNSFINFDSPYWPGYTPLHIACTYSFSTLACSLLKYGADINAKNAMGLTPFHIAIKKGDKLLINEFYSILHGNCTSLLQNNGFSFLHNECMLTDKCDSRFLETISQFSADINIPVRSDSPLWAGCTPLHIAVHKKSMSMIRILIQFGADINAKDLNEISPLQYAIHKRLIIKGLIDLILSEYNKTKINPIDDYELFELFSACMSAKSVEIQHLLKRGVNVNSAIPLHYPLDLPGYTSLHLAVESGKIDIVQLLLKNGADLCVQDMNKLSPLHLAARRSNYCIMEKILSFHTEVMGNPIDNEGLSHLHIACMIGKTDIVEKFLQYGVAVDLATRTGETPLHYAVKSGSEKTVELLLKHNADFTVQETQGSTPLHIAVWSKKEKIVNMILSVSSNKILNPVDMTGLSHFHIACMKDKSTLVEKLLFNGLGSTTQVKSDSSNYAGFTPLHFAVKYNCLNIVKILLNNDVDFTTKDALNKFPMHYAFKLSSNDSKKMLDLFWFAIKAKTSRLVHETELFTLYIICIINNYSALKKLLKQRQGIAIDIYTSTECPLWPGYSILHLAVKFGSVKTVKLLLSHDSCVNVLDKYGFTPLHLACSGSKKEIVVELLKKGCNPAAKSLKGLTPLRLALQAKNDEIARIILSQPTAVFLNPMDNKGLTYFHVACLKNLINIVKNFLLMAVDVNDKVHPLASKYPGYTPLHIAVERRNLIIIDLLLTHGANVNVVNSEGCTPLHLTCTARAAGSCANTASKLLKFGADPNIRSRQGDTIVELAVIHHRHEILEIALRHGADPNLKNSEVKGCRPLDLAISSRQLRILHTLLKYGADASVSCNGCTLIHKTLLVTGDESYYRKNFLLLLEYGCDLNGQDTTGRTALHRSYWPLNLLGLIALLKCGADINVEDLSGRTVVSYFLEITSSRMPRLELYKIFRRHLEVRTIADFELSTMNQQLYQTLCQTEEDYLGAETDVDTKDLCMLEFQKMRDIKFGFTTLYDLFRNVDKMAMHLVHNCALANFLKSSQYELLFPETSCLIMMRYRAALKRRDLLLPVFDSIQRLMAEGFPKINWNAECSEVLMEYLDNEDLRNLGAI